MTITEIQDCADEILHRMQAMLQPLGFRVSHALDHRSRHVEFSFHFVLGQSVFANNQIFSEEEFIFIHSADNLKYLARRMVGEVVNNLKISLESAYETSGQILPNPTVRTEYVHSGFVTLSQEEQAAILILREQTKRAKQEVHDNDPPRRIVFDNSGK